MTEASYRRFAAMEAARMGEDLSSRLEQLGFTRTEKWIWIRAHEHTADVIVLQREDNGPGQVIGSVGFEVHLAIRLSGGPPAPLALNGPRSAPNLTGEGEYDLRFDIKAEDERARCLEELGRFVEEQGEPWFRRFRTVESLLDDGGSPLTVDEKARLRAALERGAGE